MNWYATNFDGYTQIEEIELDDEPWQFDLLGVWRKDADGTLWYATDSGCSCPSPWEDTRPENLSPFDYAEIEKMVRGRYFYDHRQIPLEDALARLRKLR